MAQQKELACIFCGRSKPLKTIDLDKFENWSIDWAVLQTREILPGPGRGKRVKGGGFPAIKTEGLSILDMLEDEEYAEYVEAIKKRLIMIVKAYLDAGIIKKSEILD
ncbi:MAG: hypothetical protein ACTSSA_12555 [Candidatus Freyarchaeota archaeon]